MSKPCNSCENATKCNTGKGDIFFLCELLDCRMSNTDYVKECKYKIPKKYNRKCYKNEHRVLEN